MRALSIYSFLMAVACLGAVLFSFVFVAPKAQSMLEGPEFWEPRAIFAWFATPPLFMGKIVFAAFCLTLAGLLASIVPFFWQRLKRLLAVSGVGSSAACLAFFCIHGFSIFHVLSERLLSKGAQSHAYRRVLERFSLAQEADGIIEGAKQELAQMLHPQPITDASQLSRSDAESRLTDIITWLRKTENPALRKRLLATTPLFSSVLADEPELADIVLDSARKASGREFKSIEEFHSWLARQDPNEWKPITLYHFPPTAN